MYKNGKQIGSCRIFEHLPEAGGLTRADNGECYIEELDGDMGYCMWHWEMLELAHICHQVDTEAEALALYEEFCGTDEDDEDEEDDEIGGPTSDDDSDNNEDTNTTEPGGTTGGEEPPTTFDYERRVWPRDEVINAQNPKSGCSFYCLGTIVGADPCAIAADYFARYAPSGWAKPAPGSSCDFGPKGSYPDAHHLASWYNLMKGVSFEGIGVTYSNVSEMVSDMSPGYGIVVTSGDHVYLIYHIWSTKNGNIRMGIYDTSTDPWDKPNISVVIPSGTCHVFK